MTAYYNEIDPYAAQWLRNLIDGGHIARGDVDERDIRDVRADDLAGYAQCHFFAGIGGWSYALRLAGWPDDRPVWTGSCPCQPFSAAGAGKAADDERHLWPAWLPLIAECRPAIVFGEQVEAAVGWGWLDVVFADLEQEGYACGAAVLPACSVGAPHIRQRLWFVADAAGERQPERQRARTGADSLRRAHGDIDREQPSRTDGRIGDLADAESGRQREFGNASRLRRSGHNDGGGVAGELGDTGSTGGGRDGGAIPSTQGEGARERLGARGVADESRAASFWGDCEWLPCTDGKARPVGPGSFPLGHGIPNRPSKLRAYGNAIVPQVAAEFICAAGEAMRTLTAGERDD